MKNRIILITVFCVSFFIARSIIFAAEVHVPIDFYVNYPQDQPNSAFQNSKVGQWNNMTYYLAIKASDTSTLGTIPANATITDVQVHFGAPLTATSNDYLCWPFWFVNDSTASLLAASYNQLPSGFTISVGGGNQCIGVSSFHDVAIGSNHVDQIANAILMKNFSQPLPGYELNPRDTYYVVTYTTPVPTPTSTIGPNELTPTPTLPATCPPAGNNGSGIASLDVSLNQSGNYKVWIQMMGKGDGANSVWLQMDTLYCVKVGDLAGMPGNTWQWIDYVNGNANDKIPMPLLGSGTHTIRLVGNGNEPGVGVDRILVTRDTTCTPTGSGDACIGIVATPTSTNMPISTLTPTSTPDSTSGPTITTNVLPLAKGGVAYIATVSASDSTFSDSLSMEASGLPIGLSLGPCVATTSFGGTTITCQISGIPTKKKVFNPKFTVKDKLGHMATKILKLQVK